MKQKLIITLWKAQLSSPLPNDSIYCLLSYNNESKTSKNLLSKTSLQWKETFIFSLAKQQSTLRIDFIPLKKGQEIHFAHDNLAETLSVAKASMSVSVKAPTKGSLPAKLDVIDEQSGQSLGKVFIEYQVLKTQVAYLVQKMLEYNYVLKLSNFSVSFLRQLRNPPTFYLKLKYGQKTHRQQFPFHYQNNQFTYTYPIKLYMQKQLDLNIELQVKQFFNLDYQSAHESTMKSVGGLSDRRSQGSTTLMGKNKKDTMIDINSESKISGVIQLGFRENYKGLRKVALTTVMKGQVRDIGTVEFSVEALFKTPQEKLALLEQKRGISNKNNPQSMTIQKKKRPPNAPNLQQSNGFIMLNTIMGKLQIGPQLASKIQGKNLSLTLQLGKQSHESTILQNPGKQLIFLDTFTFKRTWQQTIKFTIQIHEPTNNIKLPMFFSSVNLRELFQTARIHSKKIKIFDEQKNYCGTFILDMEYRQQQKKQKDGSNSREKKEKKGEEIIQRKSIEKREKIAQRMRQRQEEKKHKALQSKTISLSKERDIVTMAEALDLKDLILPPLKSRKANSQISKQLRYSTLSPTSHQKKQKFRSANVYNSNGAIKFSRSPRFDQNVDKSGSSFTFVRQSDFDTRKKKGTFIGYGEKYDFTKDVKHNPGIGKYQIPSLWDKYH